MTNDPPSRDRDVLITGIGLISCLGEGRDAHLAALDRFTPVVEAAAFAPGLVHPMTALKLDAQIPKRGDQRQMEAWQRFGVYAAGLALDDAGIKGDTALLERMDMIVAAGGGERDAAADVAILAALPGAAEPDVYLNEHLLSDLRPTLFLAQLSNLLAGNISIVHGVTGSSRTFMGEEAAGADALRIACARIEAGQGDICLVGGSYNAQREDLLLLYGMGHAIWNHPFAPVWSRGEAGGMNPGSIGCFLVLESRAHAASRGATAKAVGQADSQQGVSETTGRALKAERVGQPAVERIGIVIVTRRNFAAERQAIIHVVLDARADCGHRIPAANAGVPNRMQQETRIRLVTHGAEAAHHIRTPAATEFAKEPATGNIKLHAFPLVTIAGRAALEISIVEAVFEIEGEIGVDPYAGADTTKQ